MNDRPRFVEISLSIAAVERDTGLSKDTLRIWERRYGFPTPGRDAIGERAYSLEQVERLRLIKRLLDAGHRPGRIVPLPYEALQQLGEQTVDQPQRGLEVLLDATDLREHLDRLRRHDVAGLRRELTRLLLRFGLARFVNEVVAPLNAAVAEAWLRGQLEIFEEHSYAEVMQAVLRRAIAGLPEPGPLSQPSVLLASFPGEPQGLGLLMAEAAFALEGCACVSLGTQTPLWDIARAAGAFRSDIVALSFSGRLNPNQVLEGLEGLRAKLPPSAQLWAGGSAPVLHRRSVPGVLAFSGFDELPAALQRWREALAQSEA